MKRQLISYLLAAAACAAALVGCTREPETQPEVYDQETEYEVVLTASLAPDTRAVSVTSEAVTATWSPNDKVALVYNNKILTALEVTGISGNSAQLSGKVYGAYPTNTAMTLYYGGVNADFTGIRYDYSGQDGTAEEAAKRAYLQADVKIAKQENKKLTLGDATTGGAITLAHQQAYYELNFQYGPDVLKVRSVEVTGSTGIVKNRTLTDNGFTGSEYAGTDADHFTVTTTAAEGLSTVYFVFSDVSTPPTADGFLYDFTITDVNGQSYSAEWKLEDGKAVKLELDKRGPAVNGTYRSGIWVLDRQTPVPTAPQAQSVVYDAQPHELVTAGSIPYGEGQAEGAVLMYYYAKSTRPVNEAMTAADTLALAPNANSTWQTEVPVETEPGHYCVWYKVVGGRYFNDVPPTPVVEIDPDNDPNTLNAALIDKRRLDVTAPTAISNLKYTGSAQALVNAGTIKDKTSEEFDPGIAMQYCVFEGENPPMDLNNAAWITEVPQAVNAGKYHIWYKVDSTAHYHGLAPADSPITVTIATTDAVIANPEPIVNLIYNGEYQQLVLPADASDGCKVYYYVATSNLTREQVVALGDDIWVAPADLESTDPLYEQFVPAPKKRDAGTYYIWTKVVDVSANGAAGNYSGVPGISEAAVVAEIAPIAITVTAYPQTNWTYDGDARALMTQWMTVTFKSKTSDTDNALDEPTPAKLYYKFPGETSFTLFTPASPHDIATKTDAGSYTVQYYVVGAPNFESFHSASDPASFTVTVAKAPVVITGVTGVPDLVYDGSDQVLLSAGGTIQFASTHPSKAGVTIPGSTGASIHYRWDRANIGGGGTASSSASDELTPYTNVKGNHAGVYTVYYKVVGGNNYISTSYNATDKLDVTIAKAEMTGFAVDITGWTYGQLANAPSVTGNAGGGSVSITYSVKDANSYSSDVPTNAGDYTVRAIAAATDDYESATAYKDFTIEKADPTVNYPTVSAATLTYGGQFHLLSSAGSSSHGSVGYGYYFSRTETTPTEPDVWESNYSDLKGFEAGYYYIYVKVIGDPNHNDKVFGPIDGSPKQVNKAENIHNSAPAVPSELPLSSGSVTDDNISDAMEYCLSTDGGSTWSDWSSENISGHTISGLSLGTLRIRYKGDSNYLPSSYATVTLSAADPT